MKLAVLKCSNCGVFKTEKEWLEAFSSHPVVIKDSIEYFLSEVINFEPYVICTECKKEAFLVDPEKQNIIHTYAPNQGLRGSGNMSFESDNSKLASAAEGKYVSFKDGETKTLITRYSGMSEGKFGRQAVLKVYFINGEECLDDKVLNVGGALLKKVLPILGKYKDGKFQIKISRVGVEKETTYLVEDLGVVQ